MAELERSERLVTEKYNRTKAQLAEFEGENERMKVVLKQKEKEIHELKKVTFVTRWWKQPLHPPTCTS